MGPCAQHPHADGQSRIARVLLRPTILIICQEHWHERNFLRNSPDNPVQLETPLPFRQQKLNLERQREERRRGVVQTRRWVKMVQNPNELRTSNMRPFRLVLVKLRKSCYSTKSSLFNLFAFGLKTTDCHQRGLRQQK